MAWIAGVQNPPAAATFEPVIDVGAYRYNVSGRQIGWASTGEPWESTGFLWVDGGLCAGGAASSLPPFRPGSLVWRVTGRIIGQEAGGYVVDVTWQRVNSQGQPDGSPSVKRLTIRPEESQQLERLTPAAASACAAAEMQLRAAVRLAAVGARGGGGRGGGRVVATPMLAREAEIWLVHTLPNGKTESLRMDSPVMAPPYSPSMGFSFETIAVPTPSGDVGVWISGSGQIQSDGQANTLAITITRLVFTPVGVPGPRSRIVGQGNTTQTVALPDPNEVVAFDLPPLKRTDASDDLLSGHRFSIRVRVKPAR
jgi:hypothetical protein